MYLELVKVSSGIEHLSFPQGLFQRGDYFSLPRIAAVVHRSWKGVDPLIPSSPA